MKLKPLTEAQARAKCERLYAKACEHAHHDWNGWSKYASATYFTTKGLRITRRIDRIADKYINEMH